MQLSLTTQTPIFKLTLAATFILGAFATGCSKGASSSSGSGGSAVDAAVAGKLTTVSASSVHTQSVKTITHVMAVNPSTGSSERFVSAVASDGTFSLGITSGKPYVIVFISQDGTLTGPDMIVSTVRIAADGLDTLPVSAAATVELGDVTPSVGTGLATISTSVSALHTALGITSTEAAYIGSVDDLALRLANPDVDMNGTIDALENKSFMMDMHIRANTKLSGSDLLLTDVENAFANAANVSNDWTLGSIYAIYPSSFDSGSYASGGALVSGGGFAATGTAITASSYSGGSYGGSYNFGPDYNMSTGETGGSDAAAVMTFNLGSSAKQLRFSNVRTKTVAQLNANGVMMPFVKINTSGGFITGIGYKWMKRTSSAWADASAVEVQLLVQSQGAYLKLYTQKSTGVEVGLGFKIPTTAASGTVSINGEGFVSEGSPANPTAIAIANVCSTAMSYDDKMGLRLFMGAPVPASVTCP